MARRLAHAGLVALGLVLCVPLPACGGSGVRSGVSLGPRLASARLGSLRSAMTYDGDWLGGMPPLGELECDLELAARRGVEIVIDVRSEHAQSVQPIADAVQAAGLELVSIRHVEVAASSPTDDEPQFPVTPNVVDDVLRVLNAPGRRRSLLLDENGTRSSMIYAIHLAVDEGIAEAEALRAARATGLSQACADFVRSQVDRLSGASRR